VLCSGGALLLIICIIVVVFACRKKKKTRGPKILAPAKETVEHDMTRQDIEELKQFKGLSPASHTPYAILSYWVTLPLLRNGEASAYSDPGIF